LQKRGLFNKREKNMKYEKETVGKIVVVRIQESKLTSHEAPDLKTSLLELIIGDGEYIILNMKNVEYMDSTGLGGFLFGIRQAESYDKEIVFCEIKPRIQSLVRIAHLDQVIGIYKTEKEALKDIQEEETSLES
jgi:anti-anti-sigma factor